MDILWELLAFGHSLFTLYWESEMTSLKGEFVKTKLGMLNSDQLFSFLLLEVGLVCSSPRGRSFYVTWVCPRRLGE